MAKYIYMFFKLLFNTVHLAAGTTILLIGLLVLSSHVSGMFYTTTVTLDVDQPVSRSVAVALARYCFDAQGAVATISKGKDGEISRVQCDVRVRQ